jgi:uncharacterized membrane protein
VILTSGIARAFPIPDATLGAVAYLVEAILAAAGGDDRWRTEPWLVSAFGLVVLGLVLTGLVLVGAQLLAYHTGCTLCLASAAISFTNGWLARDEILASVGELRARPSGDRTS